MHEPAGLAIKLSPISRKHFRLDENMKHVNFYHPIAPILENLWDFKYWLSISEVAMTTLISNYCF
jgi:hypothetical protein